MQNNVKDSIYISPKELFDELLNKFKIKEKIGNIQISLGGVSASYSSKDAIGELLQEWVKQFLISRNYYFRTRKNTQEFPDFILHNKKDYFLELKTFNSEASPAFDIANFDSYSTSLLEKPERLNSDYLILSYKMKNSVLSIDNLWLKKVWEISSPSGPNKIKLQVKRKQIYNIRPCTWYSKNLKYKPFKSRIEFVKGISEVHQFYPQCNNYKYNWFNKVSKTFLDNTGELL